MEEGLSESDMLDGCSYGVHRAINELASIFSCQWSNGMLPQIRFMSGQHGYRPDADDWGVPPEVSGPTRYRTSGITQPPIIGLCAREVFLKIGPDAQRAHFADFVGFSAALEKYHHWLLSERDPWHEGLLVCLHPWETGTDNSPAFDSLIEATRSYIEASSLPVDAFGRADTAHVSPDHRPTERDYHAYFGLVALFKKHGYGQAPIIAETPFLLQDVLFNSLFVASLYSLAQLQDALSEMSDADMVDMLRERAAQNRRRAGLVASAIRRKLWHPDDRFFYSYDQRGGGLLEVRTVSGLIPLVDGIADAEQAGQLAASLLDSAKFWTRWPIPSTAQSSPAFNPVRYWSGPSWPVTNWLVLRGLQEREMAQAEELRERTLRMIAEGADYEQVREAAMRVMQRNSFGEELTTPSTRQYQHGWLWDSAIVAASWPLVDAQPEQLADREGDPGFWEYYEPSTGRPLGAPRMTWTASLFLELLNMDQANKL